MRVSRAFSAVSSLAGVRTTTTPAIPMGSPRILETVCGSIKFVIVCKLGLDLVAFLMTGENNIRYFRRRMYAVALPDGILKYFFDTCIWTLLAWFIDILLI